MIRASVEINRFIILTCAKTKTMTFQLFVCVYFAFDVLFGFKTVVTMALC